MHDSCSREKTKSISSSIKDMPYVSRGGLKIEHAFQDLDLTIKDKNAIDVGASTGGFTDFLLKNGAKNVVTIDVGYGILAWKLRNDPGVTVFERTNIRYFDVESLPFLADFTVVDVSFISLRTIFDKILKITKDGGEILVLVKPQFEVKKDEVEKGGIIRNKNLHLKVLKILSDFISKLELIVEGIAFSKIKGAKGNIEFWIYIKKYFMKTGLNFKKSTVNYDKIITGVVSSAHSYFK